MTPSFADYDLPETFGRVEAEDRLAGHFRLGPGSIETSERTYYDTFDGRLHAAGLRLAADDAGLVVENGAGEVGHAPAPRLAGPGILVTQLPQGGLRDLLAPVVEMRALTPLVRIRSTQRSLRVLDDEAKTVARLVLEEPQLVAGDGTRAPLGPRLRICGVRGYDDEFAAVCRVLQRELALAPAYETLLDAAVRATGGSPAGVSSKLDVTLRRDERSDRAAAQLLLQLAGTISRNLPGVLDDVDSEFLHDLRVAVRRTRSAQRQLLPVFPPGPIAHFRAEFRWVQQVTGPTRDFDVYLWEFDDLRSTLPEDRRADLEPLRRLLRRRRRTERGRMVRTLRSDRFATLLGEWPELLESLAAAEPGGPHAARPIAELASERIGAVYRRMVKAGSAIREDSPAGSLHDLRKQGKELRYLLELFASLYAPEVVTPLVRTLKGLQDTLGRFYDREMQAEALRSLRRDVAALPQGPETLMAMGQLVARLDADQALARSEFASRFAAFASKRQRTLVRATFT